MRKIALISEDLKVDYFQIQHFITDSNRDARQVTSKVALNFLVSKFILKEYLICFEDALSKLETLCPQKTGKFIKANNFS